MTSSIRLRRRSLSVAGATLFVAALSTVACGISLTVRVSGISSAGGEIGCALFRDSDGFPMDSAKAKQIWLRADPRGVTCNFSDLPVGSYAVSVSHDLNGNKRVDTNFLSLPIESWRVSNNARPVLRAPRFDEASFKIVAGTDATIDIKVDK